MLNGGSAYKRKVASKPRTATTSQPHKKVASSRFKKIGNVHSSEANHELALKRRDPNYIRNAFETAEYPYHTQMRTATY